MFRRGGGVRLGVQQTLRGSPMNVLIVAVVVLCFAYLLYVMIRPERF
jgi:K+-transporting ATPase KdpF subunit